MIFLWVVLGRSKDRGRRLAENKMSIYRGNTAAHYNNDDDNYDVDDDDNESIVNGITFQVDVSTRVCASYPALTLR